ncbi:unnamed protein product [Cylicocyclus nassatus]|uniref:Uncharacterized protein n=1 Tax=Cylicocyclus nassatus TaxID=53992 RepID=A0AA36HEJ1_CYLNA|nr:unnamed protein product [Cylicocyclus nassatus]
MLLKGKSLIHAYFGLLASEGETCTATTTSSTLFNGVCTFSCFAFSLSNNDVAEDQGGRVVVGLYVQQGHSRTPVTGLYLIVTVDVRVTDSSHSVQTTPTRHHGHTSSTLAIDILAHSG